MKRILVALICVLILTPQAVSANSSNEVISIIHINDVHGYAIETDAAIGYSKIAGYIQEYKKTHPNTLVLDGGDVFQGNVYAAFDGGKNLINILNTMGFDAVTAGNADFMFGTEKLSVLAGQLKYPMLTANIKLNSQGGGFGGIENLQDYTIVQAGDKKVGIIGLTTEDSMFMVLDTCTYISPIDKAKEIISELEGKVDILVGLVHLGSKENADYTYTSEDLAEAVPAFDLLIDGHSHDIINKVVNGVPIVQTGAYSANVGVLELTLANGNVVDVKETLLPKEYFENIKDNPETLAETEKMLDAYGVFASEIVGRTEVPLDGKRENIRTKETNMGNLFTDAMREHTGADIAMIAAGLVGGEFEPGQITQGDVMTIARIEANVVTVQMTGEQILESLNDSVRLYPDLYGDYSQVSGISFQFDPDRQGNRVYEVHVGQQPLELSKTYVVACSESMYKSSVGFMETKLLKDWGSTDRIIGQYFKTHEGVSPKEEGRIIIGKSPDLFSDVHSSDWYADAVNYVTANGIMSETGMGIFNPSGIVTRGEFVSAIYKLAGGEAFSPSQGMVYVDVSPEDSYGKPVLWAAEKGICIGIGNNLFHPGEEITRQEAAAIMSRFMSTLVITDETSQEIQFTDGAEIKSWAKDHVSSIFHWNAIWNIQDGMFRPSAALTRGEAAASLYYLSTMMGNKDVL